jgi:hypothetical protein
MNLDYDPVKPGEQWFFYWNTSAALWEQKILEFPSDATLFIPLYWGFHAEGQSDWDFGKYHPERDLKRLVKVLTQHGRKFCWILPLTPAPFLPNGGVPVHSARVLSITSEGIHLASFDGQGLLNKMYSFFSPKVLQSYSEFLNSFARFLVENKCQAPVWGGEFFYRLKGEKISFLEDHSTAFEQGFSRYLKKNFPEGTEIDLASKEHQLKNQFTQEVSSLFRTISQEILAPFWEGKQEITIFGSSPKDTIQRSLPSGKAQIEYFQDLFESFIQTEWFSTSLLQEREKKELLKQCLGEHFNNDQIEEKFKLAPEQFDLSEVFHPLALVDIYIQGHPEVWQNNGLLSFMKNHYRWIYYLHGHFLFTHNEIEAGQNRIRIFHARGMDRTHFAQMLKLFMMGQKVIFDSQDISSELEKRLEIFYLENNLKIQSINYQTNLTMCQLGEGHLVRIDGEKLKTSSSSDSFWSHLFQYLNVNHPQVICDNDVYNLWRIRATSPHELNYLDVRRINLYNPTSYKKQVSIHTQKKFAFMKVIDPQHAQARTTPYGVEIELLPNGKLALDFGHYEER